MDEATRIRLDPEAEQAIPEAVKQTSLEPEYVPAEEPKPVCKMPDWDRRKKQCPCNVCWAEREQPDRINMGEWGKVRFGIAALGLKGKRYGATNILGHIRAAKTPEELHQNLLRAMAETSASAATKRKWKAAAEVRLGQLRVQQVEIIKP